MRGGCHSGQRRWGGVRRGKRTHAFLPALSGGVAQTLVNNTPRTRCNGPNCVTRECNAATGQLRNAATRAICVRANCVTAARVRFLRRALSVSQSQPTALRASHAPPPCTAVPPPQQRRAPSRTLPHAARSRPIRSRCTVSIPAVSHLDEARKPLLPQLCVQRRQQLVFRGQC